MRRDGTSWARRLLVVGLCLLAVALATGGRFAQAGGKSDSEVKIKTKSTKIDAAGKQTVTLELAINKGWHLYANPIGNADFAANQTVVKVDAKVKLADVKVVYPKGKLHEDKVVGDYRVYEGKITIEAHVQRAEGDTSPLELSVRFSACNNKGQCLLPATVKLTVP